MKRLDMTTDQRPVSECDNASTHDARQLIPNGVKADITLDGQTYTLRITRAGKLILTK
ncbi:hemin uptake protein HemP [Loktanella sp. 3ANDIMAR09]|uniref:hemin uptake protein HemP n=1 Tax=Loktanella sp. 3ANDIMAR09 TaxID=1225657 RepID=UPI000A5F9F8A|nr:hemin uptake protein HemP [Loktanella sp. 3ANDIMAR09]